MRSKKKFTSFIALLALTMMLFTGCVRSGIGVVIEANDTGTVEVSVGIALIVLIAVIVFVFGRKKSQ